MFVSSHTNHLAPIRGSQKVVQMKQIRKEKPLQVLSAVLLICHFVCLLFYLLPKPKQMIVQTILKSENNMIQYQPYCTLTCS